MSGKKAEWNKHAAELWCTVQYHLFKYTHVHTYIHEDYL